MKVVWCPGHALVSFANVPNPIMKHLLIIALLLPVSATAQKEFPAVWESKFAVDAKFKGFTEDLEFVIGGDMTEVQVLDGGTGKSLWVYNFKEKNGVNKCDRWRSLNDSETIEVTIQQKGKDGTQEIFYLDYATGQVVGETHLVERAAKVKKAHLRTPRAKGAKRTVIQSSCYDAASNTTVDIGYDGARNLSAKGGTDVNITVEASGANAWKSSFTGKVVRHLNQDMLAWDESEVILGVSTGHGKVFVVYEGITCLDLVSGKVLWSTTFDNVQTDGGLKVTQEIGRSAMPLPAADGVYLCDFSKGERTIKKLDLNTGAVLWQADKLKKDDIVSELVLDGSNLIARFGGLIRKEQYIPGIDGNPDVYKVEYLFEGSTSLRAYDATTGKAGWTTEAMDLPDNFKKSECNILSSAGRIYACGEKNLYIFETATGTLLKQGDYNSKTVGKAHALYPYGAYYIIEGEKGIAQLDAELGQKYATSTGKCLLTEMQGDAFIVWTGKKPDERNEFLRFDPANGAILGSMSDCFRPRFNLSGDRFLKFDGQKVTQYSTN